MDVPIDLISGFTGDLGKFREFFLKPERDVRI
jgi:hypothetical protein